MPVSYPQIILITGASRGIGLATARHLRALGHRVVGTSRRPEEAGVADVPLWPLDVTDVASIEAMAQRARAELGQVDVLVNNAGYDLYAAAEETSADEFAAQLAVNLVGPAQLTRALLPLMRAAGGGKIINISSIGGRLSLPYNSAYAASKFGLEGYSESLRYELLPHGIHVSLVEPASVRTDTLATSILSPQDDHPAYAADRQRMTAQMHRNGAASPVTPDDIARTVAQIVAAPRPRLRYAVGAGARWLPPLKALLPERWYEAFIMRQFMPTRGTLAKQRRAQLTPMEADHAG